MTAKRTSSAPKASAFAKRTGLRIAGVAFFVAVAWLILGYIILPMFLTLDVSLGGEGVQGLGAYSDYFSQQKNSTAVLNTLAIGAMCTVTCGIVGSALAVYLRFFCKKHVKALKIVLVSPVMIPGVIIVVAFIQLYGESGMVTKLLQMLPGPLSPSGGFGGFWGIVFVITYTQYVYFYMNIYAALQNIDKSVVECVQSMGGGAWSVFRDAIWPVVRTSVVVSAMTTFVSAIGSYSAPALIGGSYRVLSTQIVAAKSTFDMQLASVEVMVLLVMGLAAVVLSFWLRRRLEVRAPARSERYDPDLSRASVAKVVFTAFVVLQVVLVSLPVVAIVYLSFMTTKSIMMNPFPTDATFANYEQVFTNARTFKPLSNSLVMSLMAVAAVAVLSIPTVLAGRKRPDSGKAGTVGSMGARGMQVLMALPWCMPASVIAIDLINMFNQPSAFAFGQTLVGTFQILPIAYSIHSLPLMLSSSQVAVEGVRDNVEDASRSLGAGPLRTFARVTLPAIAPGIMSGAILVFVRTMGEYTMSALLYGVSNRPISVSIVTNMQEYAVGVSMAYGALVILVCCVLLFAILKLDKARFGV